MLSEAIEIRKRKIRRLVTILVITAVVGGGIIWRWSSALQHWKTGHMLFDAQEFEMAIHEFEEAGRYADSLTMLQESLYQSGYRCLQQGEYRKAADAFMDAGIEYKDIKKLICTTGELSACIPKDIYSLEQRIYDSVSLRYGSQLFSMGNGNISGQVYGDYSFDGRTLQISINERNWDKSIIKYVFRVFFMHCYGIFNDDIESEMATAMADIRYDREVSFYLESKGLKVSFGTNSGYTSMKCEHVPMKQIQSETMLERNALDIMRRINTATKSKNLVEVRSFSYDGGTVDIDYNIVFSETEYWNEQCQIEGKLDVNSNIFTIDRVSVYFPKEYADQEDVVVDLLVGIVEGVYQRDVSETDRKRVNSVFHQMVEQWHREFDKYSGFSYSTDQYTVQLNGVNLTFSIGQWDFECSFEY